MKSRFLKEWLKIAEVILTFFIGATCIFYLLSLRWPLFLHISYHFIVSMLMIQAALTYWYTVRVFKREKFIPRLTSENKKIPRTTFIVTAYLPNEIEVVEKSILNILQNIDRPEDGIEVILAYNTPHMEPLELKLRGMVMQWPELILANAHNSRSKSENLNYALSLSSGGMTVLLDSDHLVARDCLRRAWRWLDEGYDVVQGRCKVRNADRGFVPQLVEVEFEGIYGIQHPSKSIIFDTTLFGGSNGYWKSSVIRKVKFLPQMLTEDIDSTLRGVLAGYRFVHDRSIISSELAPVSIWGLWFQRKRWAQGWFQCSFKYQSDIWKTQYLNFGQKFIWTTLLLWRVFYDVTSTFLFPVVFAFWLKEGAVKFPMNAYLGFALIFTLVSGPFQVIAAYKNASQPRGPLVRYIVYMLFVWPYTLFKTFVHMVAIRDELLGERAWVLSRRD